ncbi:hypothetical protein HZU75_04620 [Chitinibacter fontanus]|uniref:Uncharacterized protein n=1 Tax=Chitinibacter fontanus TaxID=1737446 RepID=A0A7D5ZFF4_9NEIS|nr:hypothetical protein [Chitinibacter fontanus]QLI80869.1 hypothetical protein HZU75_04620 [Chitinibacter fontanus]
MITYTNSLEDWLELTLLVAQMPEGADWVLAIGEQDRQSGLALGYGRRLLEATIRNGQFYFADLETPES